MSRIGKQLIELPANVEVTINGQSVSVKGPKGKLDRELHPMTLLEKVEGGLQVTMTKPCKLNTKFQGLTRSLVNNMVIGVSSGFSKSLTLVGVGYRAAIQGKDLNLTLGYSHPVVHKVPDDIDVKVEKQTTVLVSGIDKELVGQVAANIRAYRKPEVYHGKGVRYTDERIVTKAGKTSGKK